jgi:hypothetical protein
MTSTAIRSFRFAAAAAAAGIAGLSATSASAVDMRVAMACAGDYYALCSQHPTEGPAVRQCMRTNGHKLSKRCVSALISAGEVSQAEVDRRSASASAR